MTEAPATIPADAFAFFRALAEDNTRDFFAANKARFKSAVEAPFTALVAALTARLAGGPVPFRGGPKTIYRLNRDVRFAKDKTPYKTNMSALLTASGLKSGPVGPFVYLQMEPGGGFAAAGVYDLPPSRLGPIRDALVHEADAFDAVLAALEAAGRPLVDMGGLKAMPRGYAEHAAHRHAAHLRRTSLFVRHRMTEDDWTGGAAVEHAARLAEDAAPFLSFLADALAEDVGRP